MQKARGGSAKKAVVSTSSLNASNYTNDFIRQNILIKLLMNTNLINYLNKVNDYQLFSVLVSSLLSLSAPFKFYELLQYLLENFSSEQAGYVSRVIIESPTLITKLYNNNAIFLFTHIYDLIEFITSTNKEKNLNELIQIVSHIKNQNALFSSIYDLIFYNFFEKVYLSITLSISKTSQLRNIKV
jgi:hypothetical protein